MYERMMYANYINSMKNKGKLVFTQTILDQYFEYYIINVGTGFVLEVICKTSIHYCDMINGYFLPNNNVIDEVKKDLKKYLNYVLTKYYFTAKTILKRQYVIDK